MIFDNPAAELGPQKFPWWPDWRGQYCAIIASGPSAKSADIKSLRGKVRVIAIKETIDLAPFADVVYGCDFPWWRFRRGLPDFKGLKISWDPRTAQNYPDVKRIEIRDRNLDRILLEEPGAIGSSGNSGFQALNMAAQFGVNGTLLVGFDCTDKNGVHFYGRNNWDGANNPARENFQRWQRGFASAAAFFLSRGVDIVNCSPDSAVTAFRKDSIKNTLNAWGVDESQYMARL